jgi:acyl-CoA dehydrogenase
MDGSEKSLSLVAVETNKAEGFRRGRNLEKIGMHGQDTSELFFDDAFIAEEDMLGGMPGKGFHQLMQQLAWERMTIALCALVSMERAVDLAADYTLQRNAFGKPLFDFQNVQFVLADARTQATVGRTFFDAMMVRLLANDLDDVSASMAKL